MNEESKSRIELEVRRILSAEELKISRTLSDEVKKHREFLQMQFRTITWALGVLVVFVVTVFAFLLGRSYDTIQKRIIQEVDQKVIEYRIVEDYKNRLQEQLAIILTGDNVRSQITDAVNRQLTDNLADIVAKEVKQSQGKDLNQLIDTGLRPYEASLNSLQAIQNLKIERAMEIIWLLHPDVEKRG